MDDIRLVVTMCKVVLSVDVPDGCKIMAGNAEFVPPEKASDLAIASHPKSNPSRVLRVIGREYVAFTNHGTSDEEGLFAFVKNEKVTPLKLKTLI